MGLVLMLIAAVLMVGPAIAAYVVLPPAVADAWPVFTLTFLPTVAAMTALLVFRAYQPLIDAPLPDSAARWLRRAIDHTGRIGISVAAMERGEHHHGSFYHPASQTIVLGDDVHDEHTARAYATAAHELGHALFHIEHPVLGRGLMAARRSADRCFYQGTALLFGAALVGGAGFRLAAFLLMVLAVVLQALVVADEVIASKFAAQVLRDEVADPEQAAIARGDLRRALATYVAVLVAYLLPIAAAPWVLAHIGDGLLAPAPPLAGTRAIIASVIAVVCVAGAVAAVQHVLWPYRGRVALLARLAALGQMPVVFALCWSPLLAVLVLGRPDVPSWTVVLAAVPAWSLLCLPALLALRFLGGFLGRDLDAVPLPFQGPRTMRLDRVSIKKLAEDEEPDGILARAWAHSITLWIVPLAIAWLIR